jgi:hypothetical protein
MAKKTPKTKTLNHSILEEQGVEVFYCNFFSSWIKTLIPKETQ